MNKSMTSIKITGVILWSARGGSNTSETQIKRLRTEMTINEQDDVMKSFFFNIFSITDTKAMRLTHVIQHDTL